MSALPLKADMPSVGIDVRYVPEADILRPDPPDWTLGVRTLGVFNEARPLAELLWNAGYC